MPERPEEGFGSSGAGVIDDCESSAIGAPWDLNLGPQQRWSALLNTEPPPQH